MADGARPMTTRATQTDRRAGAPPAGGDSDAPTVRDFTEFALAMADAYGRELTDEQTQEYAAALARNRLFKLDDLFDAVRDSEQFFPQPATVIRIHRARHGTHYPGRDAAPMDRPDLTEEEHTAIRPTAASVMADLRSRFGWAPKQGGGYDPTRITSPAPARKTAIHRSVEERTGVEIPYPHRQPDAEVRRRQLLLLGYAAAGTQRAPAAVSEQEEANRRVKVAAAHRRYQERAEA